MRGGGNVIPMKGITCCADCAYYNLKKHCCTRAYDEGKPTDHFYADCPLPDVAPMTQEARMMQLDEIMEIYNADPFHIWPYDTPPYLYIQEHPHVHNSSESWAAWREIKDIIEGELFGHTAQSYGKTWRCWTIRPTDAQRKVTPWAKI